MVRMPRSRMVGNRRAAGAVRAADNVAMAAPTVASVHLYSPSFNCMLLRTSGLAAMDEAIFIKNARRTHGSPLQYGCRRD